MLRVPVAQLVRGEMTLDTETSRYVARVHRLQIGDVVALFDPENALEATGTITVVDKSSVRVAVADVHAAVVRATRPVTLVQAIGKGDKIDAIVRDATELGATRIIIAETTRSVVRLGDRANERLLRWRRIAVQAARQCGRGDAPDVIGPLPWQEALRDAAQPPGLALCLWERATNPIGPKLRDLAAATPLAVAVGAEGGFEPGEIAVAEAEGFIPVSLGPFILRTETVPAAVLGAALLSAT